MFFNGEEEREVALKAWLISMFWLLIAGTEAAPGNSRLKSGNPGGADRNVASLLILDPVDIGKNTRRIEVGVLLKKVLGTGKGWKTLGMDSLEGRMRQSGLRPPTQCREFQCAYEAATTLETGYALYGTATEFRDMESYTLHLLHVPTARVIWSTAGKVRGEKGVSPAIKLAYALQEELKAFTPAGLELAEPHVRFPTAVLQLGSGSLPARIIKEQVTAYLASTRRYDILSSTEVSELLSVMDLESAIADGRWNEVGRHLGVSRLFCTRVENSEGNYRAEFIWTDIHESRLLRNAASPSQRDFFQLLDFETEFFREALEPFERNVWIKDGIFPTKKASPLKVGLLGLGLAATATFATKAFLAWEVGKREASRVNHAHSQEAALYHQSQMQKQKENLNFFGTLGFIGALTTISVIWSF